MHVTQHSSMHADLSLISFHMLQHHDNAVQIQVAYGIYYSF